MCVDWRVRGKKMTYASRYTVPSDVLTLGRNDTRQAFRDRRCETQSFFDDGAKIW